MNKQSVRRQHRKTTGYWVYVIKTPDCMYYTGMSKLQPNLRHRKSNYKETSLFEYIERFGWDSMEISILQDGMTKKEAEQIEDSMIQFYRSIGRCINQQRSGGIARDDINRYSRNYHTEHREERLEYKRQHYAENREKILEQNRQYRAEHREETRQHDKNRRSTPEGKIYNRVNAYNQRHPDKAIESPLEAKRRYLETGYIPKYIKHDDLT